MTESPTPRPTDVQRFVALQLGVTILFAALVVVVFGRDDEDALWWVAAALVLVVFLAAALVSRWWSRAAPLAPDEPAPEHTAMRRLSSHIARAFVVLEIPLVAAAVLGLVGVLGGASMLVPVLAAVTALGFGTWPTRRNVDRFATALERDGARSGIREAFAQ